MAYKKDTGIAGHDSMGTEQTPDDLIISKPVLFGLRDQETKS